MSAKRTKAADLDDTVDDLDAAAFMYETCLEQLKSKKLDATRDSDLSAMRIGERAVTFERSRCSNHAMRALTEWPHGRAIWANFVRKNWLVTDQSDRRVRRCNPPDTQHLLLF